MRYTSNRKKMQVMEQCNLLSEIDQDGVCNKTKGVLQAESNFHIHERY